MRAKPVSSKDQLRFIMECRCSGLSDYQWCQNNGIKPGTFYNWIDGCVKMVPRFRRPTESRYRYCREQSVVKMDLVSEPEAFPLSLEQNVCKAADQADTLNPVMK